MKNFPNLFSQYFWIVLLCPLVLLSGCNNSSSSSSLSYQVVSTGDANTGSAAEKIELDNASDKAVTGLSWSIADDSEQTQATNSNSNFFEVYDGTNAFKNWCSDNSCADSCSNLLNDTLAAGESCVLYIRAVVGDGAAGSIYHATLSISHNSTSQPKQYRLSNSVTLYVGGHLMQTGDGNITDLGNIAEFSNGQWQAMGSQKGFLGYVYTLVMDGVGNIYAGGGISRTGDESVSNLGGIAEFRDGLWQAVGNQQGFNNTVRALTMGDENKLYAGGNFTQTGETNLGGIAQFSGGPWQAVGSQDGFKNDDGSNGIVYALTMDDENKLYAGGSFTQTGDGNITDLGNIAEFSNGQWQAVGSQNGFNSTVYTLMTNGAGDLYAGGSFTQTEGDDPVTNLGGIAEFSNGQWQAVGNQDGFDSYVATLTEDDAGDLYAGGSFTQTGDGSVSDLGGVAEFHNGQWRAVGNNQDGLDGSVHALTIDGANNLYAAGNFLQTGGDDPVTNLGNIAELHNGEWQAVGDQGGLVLSDGLRNTLSTLIVGAVLSITPLNSD